MINKKKKLVLRDIAAVLLVTLLAIVVMINVRDWVNHTESMRAMEHLSRIITEYREKYKAVPPQPYIDRVKEELEGYARFGGLTYRALWITFDSEPDEILAYLERNYSSWFIEDGFIVLQLNGQVVTMLSEDFKKLLAEQQTPLEIKMTQ